LSQILKQQQRGNSKAGIGMSLNPAGFKHNHKKKEFPSGDLNDVD
jgi:hypothetical protein